MRQNVGYDRYESTASLNLLTAIYVDLERHVNFFRPTLKLAEKKREGSKVRKRYEPARTPYRRVIASPIVPDEDKAQLRQIYLDLNPLALQRQVEANLHLLWNLK